MKSFAVCFKGGLARGLGSIGLIRYLQENDLKPSIYAGSSSGAIIATAYALNYNWNDVIKLWDSIKFRDFMSLTALLKEGSITERNKLIKGLVNTSGINRDTKIEDLPNKLHILVSDKHKRERVAISKGNLIDALMTSFAYPFIFPKPQGDFLKFTDGDFTGGYSAKLLRESGVDKVIGIGYKPLQTKVKITNNPINNIVEIYRLLIGEIDDLRDMTDPPDMEIEYLVRKHSYFNFKVNSMANRVYKQVIEQEDAIKKLLA